MALDIQDPSRSKDSVCNLVCPVPTIADLLAQGGRLAVWHDMSLPQILQRIIWRAWRSSRAGSEDDMVLICFDGKHLPPASNWMVYTCLRDPELWLSSRPVGMAQKYGPLRLEWLDMVRYQLDQTWPAWFGSIPFSMARYCYCCWQEDPKKQQSLPERQGLSENGPPWSTPKSKGMSKITIIWIYLNYLSNLLWIANLLKGYAQILDKLIWDAQKPVVKFYKPAFALLTMHIYALWHLLLQHCALLVWVTVVCNDMAAQEKPKAALSPVQSHERSPFIAEHQRVLGPSLRQSVLDVSDERQRTVVHTENAMSEVKEEEDAAVKRFWMFGCVWK